MGSFYFLWKCADITSKTFVWPKHFTNNCFLNLGQFRAGLDERLKINRSSYQATISDV